MFPVSQWIIRATARLKDSCVEAPGREARLLLAHALAVTREQLLLAPDREVPAEADALLARRCRREPLALIIGRREFWSLDLAVSADTLVPRPDSEALVTAAITAFPNRAAVRLVLDLGTGTGCLLLALLSEFPAAWGVGVDRVAAATALARRNAARSGLADRAAFVAGDWAGAIGTDAIGAGAIGAGAIGTDANGAGFDLVVCNPPYIETGAIAGLMPEVAAYEPVSALDGGADGLACYRALLPAIPGLLAASGAAILEIGQGQAEAVGRIAAAAGLVPAGHQSDLGGVVRALVFRKAPG